MQALRCLLRAAERKNLLSRRNIILLTESYGISQYTGHENSVFEHFRRFPPYFAPSLALSQFCHVWQALPLHPHKKYPKHRRLSQQADTAI
jgi:hypothetical protein